MSSQIFKTIRPIFPATLALAVLLPAGGLEAAPPTNAALTDNGGVASQSSTIAGNGSDGAPQFASRAIDGDTNGNWYTGKITHTNYESMPWWEVQLGGGVNTITQINIWNRTDCCVVRLDNFDLTILNAGTVVWSALDQSYTQAAPEAVFPIPAVEGDTVRIQLRRADYLSLAEVQVWSSGSGPVDTDGDGVFDDSDNCLDDSNPDQNDNDVDGVGDVCDNDDDNDSVPDSLDNCPLIANTDQANTDGMGAGDACNSDYDNDGWDDQFDVCPDAYDPDQTDTDGDGAGDACDLNDDNDAFDDDLDNCPTVVNDDQSDSPDGDGIGDVCDSDDDDDGTEDGADNCPLAANSDQNDTDGDGFGDACDADIDGDAVLNEADNCPFIVNTAQDDLDGDGVGDACNDADDADGDEWLDALDNCPTTPNSGQADLDGDGVGDACDEDVDGDGTANTADQCADTLPSEVVDPANGCSIDQLCPCEGPRGTTTSWKNHGKYVSCVAHASNSFRQDGLITQSEKSAITSEAAASSCGQ